MRRRKLSHECASVCCYYVNQGRTLIANTCYVILLQEPRFSLTQFCFPFQRSYNASLLRNVSMKVYTKLYCRYRMSITDYDCILFNSCSRCNIRRRRRRS
ncbi:hypothetical protein O6H91_Y297800 [Diphasiastrum complanatum]|nr:hypothetical protein O6H91_Y297800 [Diphasiastrum complanatum]